VESLHVTAFLEMPFPRIDAIALDLPGPVDVRWYGLMYLVGFAGGFVVLRRLARAGWIAGLSTSAVGDLVATLGLGVIIGGRIGYLLVYDLRNVLANPADALRMWEVGCPFTAALPSAAHTRGDRSTSV